LAILALLLTVNHVEPGEAGLAWNPFRGTVVVQTPGYYVTPPWERVASIDIRPQRLCLTSSAHAAPNCRLAQFRIERVNDFIAVEGWRYYWLANRLSFNSGHAETYRGWRDVMRGYAFAHKPVSFIDVQEQ
jgi:hypothetical protein